jgi:transcriptional regulator with XRE-family HTH domain
MDLQRFGRAIRAVRVRRGLRQSDLAERARVSRSVVGRIERGERTGLTVDALIAVAEALGGGAEVVARVLVIWDTRTNRRRLGAHAASVDAHLPAGTRAVQRWVRDPVRPAVSGVWFVPDVRGRTVRGLRAIGSGFVEREAAVFLSRVRGPDRSQHVRVYGP